MILSNKLFSLFAGIICGLCFAPVFFLPGIFCISLLTAQIKISQTRFEAIKFAYIFGFGFYLSTLYWISFALSVYIDQFWWVIPFALFGLPAFMAIFTSIIALICWQLRDTKTYHFFFCCIWVFIEWVISWIFTGLPWALIGYAFSNWLILIQFASIFGVFGLSFVVVYIASSPYNFLFTKPNIEKMGFYPRIITSVIVLVFIVIYGYLRLETNPTEYTNISARLVQPSIPQTAKWEAEEFWRNLDMHVELSKKEGNPNLIIWSEAALTVPYHLKPVMQAILSVFANDEQILLTGGVSDNNKVDKDLELYSSLIGIDKYSTKIFEYHKAHLVPFGEYIPFKNILPLKKITPGLMDYTQGRRKSVIIKKFDLAIWPLICYEAIFPQEVRVSNRIVDLLINVTNDTWYGNSSGPYQHLEISRMRAIENGLPMLRVANNGISAFIDPVGRILSKTELNQVTVLDNYVPKKLSEETFFSKYNPSILLIQVLGVLILQLFIKFCIYFFTKNH
ncbi:MAG: apolipoprotein N-acyltransferase [Rickettsiales bacterium]|nr:apolipoprotein N-acyltransferase [Rickettsiales bacterium]